MTMQYELHPLSTLFPRLIGAEFEAMKRFSGICRERFCLAEFWIDWTDDSNDLWNFRLFDVKTGQEHFSERPIYGKGVGVLLDEFGGRENWLLTPVVAKESIEPCAGFIYFIRSGDNGPVKIGWTKSSVAARLAELQCGNPEVLSICLVIKNKSLSDERELHLRFAEQRIRGEWFSASVLDALEVSA